MAGKKYIVKRRIGYNKAGKLTELFKEKNSICVGVQGTSEWYCYPFEKKKDAIYMYNKLLNSEYK